MNSEIKPAIAALFSTVEIPENRIRARNAANKLSVIHAISDHGVDLLSEQHESVQQNIKELQNQLYPTRDSAEPPADKLKELSNMELERTIIFGVLELLTCIKHHSALKVNQGKQYNAKPYHCAMETI